MSTHELGLFDHVATIAAKMPEAAFTKPDDDWTPILFMEDASGKQVTMPIEHLMANDRAKDLLADFIIPEAIKKFQAKTAVMVLSVWRGPALAEGVDWQDRPRPSEDPNRTEELMIIEYTASGVTRYTMAEIVRHEASPPTLSEWRDLDATLGYEGRFVGPIVAAMKRVAS